MADAPQVNSLLYVTIGDNNFRTRVEDVSGDELTIGAPIGAGDHEIPDDGSELAVFWTSIRARYVMPVQMKGRTRGKPMRWHLLVTGEPVRQTRRRFVRAGCGSSLEIISIDGKQCKNLAAQLVDISEGGLRCRVSDVDKFQGGPVVAQIKLPERTIKVTSREAFPRPSHEGQGQDMVIVYELSESDAQAIRRHIFQWEGAERRNRLGLG
jgi:c-di-GMP-binding flagellar brake protein YcgR